MTVRVLLLVLAFAGVAGAWALRSGSLQIPEPWNPWATLDVTAQPNFLTRLKLSRLSRDAALCHDVLATTTRRRLSILRWRAEPRL